MKEIEGGVGKLTPLEKATFKKPRLIRINKRFFFFLYIYVRNKSHLQNIKISLSLNIIETLKDA